MFLRTIVSDYFKHNINNYKAAWVRVSVLHGFSRKLKQFFSSKFGRTAKKQRFLNLTRPQANVMKESGPITLSRIRTYHLIVRASCTHITCIMNALALHPICTGGMHLQDARAGALHPGCTDNVVIGTHSLTASPENQVYQLN